MYTKIVFRPIFSDLTVVSFDDIFLTFSGGIYVSLGGEAKTIRCDLSEPFAKYLLTRTTNVIM